MSNIERRAGFTLVEMMAVMMIVALISALVVTWTFGSGRPTLKAVALEAAALLRRERLGAMLSGHPRHIALDVSTRSLIGDSGGIVAVPRDVSLALLAAEQTNGDLQGVARFEPDGASTGAVLAFAKERARYEVRVDWFSGRVSVDAP
ncbi:type II secretion system protein GspH [Methylosinus sporium]|uniref:Type II secretion system protein GspH n=1 Tax=Methylosinus sporium TaxID=428 RepID=A0A549T3F2_METSR|nr:MULTISPECIES: prepilin-type N-terminal cleavage/methylation domain-containing protein [Methylosinus]MBU3890744.1 prepilin-type N-terminal cleavage/methylation domain-containing protein [Methylosinus sp. KRF6]TRL36409.1 type II secretion system protein GspH [Methylosinus sporium]